MKDVILLTKVLFKSSLNKNENKNNSKIGKIILYILIYGYIAGFVAYIAYGSISILMLLNQEVLFLNLCFSGVLTLAIVQTLFTSLNLLFFSKDIENLLPLPISPLKVIMAKFNCLIIAQYFTTGAFLIPSLITYGILLKCNDLFFVVRVISIITFTNSTSYNRCISYNYSYEIY